MGLLQVVISVAAVVAAVSVVVRQIAATRAAREHDETHRFAAEIIDNAGEGIVVFDRELRYLLWNRFMEELTGMRADQVIGRSALDLFPHVREQQVDELLRRAF